MRRNRIKIEPAKVQPTRTIEDEVACSSPKVKRKKKNKIRKQDSDVEVENEIPAQILKFETEEILRDTTPCRESGETSSQRNDDVPKKKKKKKKIKEGVLADNISPLEEEDKVEKINGVLETNDDSNFPKSEPESSSRLWPKEKLDRLISQMEAVLPKNDSLKYTSRLGKLDWKAISFDEYSPEECQEMWRHIQAKIRCYRILKEILEDARQCINDDNFLILNGDRPKKPAKPLTSFMLYYHDTKNDVLKKHPGLNVTEISKRVSEMWKSLSPKKLEKYKNRAADLRQKYKEQLKIFYREHPEEMAGKKGKCKPDDLGFSKPKSAFQLFHQAMREKHPSSGAGELIEKCKRKWKSMSEKKKVVWIEAAQQEEASYKENLKKYESEHPGYVAPPMKTLITKRDKHILNNLSGKPKKPATNAYSLYSQESLQNGSLKEIPSKDRLAEISRRWKALAQEERDAYVARCEELQKEYKIEYQKFLDNLPPERRLEELEKMQPKRRKTDSKGSQAKKLKISEEPVQPPVNEFELFKQKHENEWNENSLIPVSDSQARAKWKKISQSEKQKYSAELQKLRSNYIGELTEYLKHCPPNKLAHYVALIALQQQQQYGGPEQITVSSEDTEPDSDSE